MPPHLVADRTRFVAPVSRRASRSVPRTTPRTTPRSHPFARLAAGVAALLTCGALALPSALRAQGTVGYYRYPTIHSDQIIFAAEGDLWSVSTTGGVAHRLTTHPAEESHPSISPDGKTLAFSASYEGPTEVYTMPVEGGVPTRRTFEGAQAEVVGWTPSGQVLYTTRHYSTLPETQLASIDLASGARTLVPLAQAADGSYDSSGKTLFFTRLPFQGSYTKRYKGGMAQDIWRFAAGGKEAVPLTADFNGTSRSPMWWKGRVYFVSDRDGTMNLWSMDANGKGLKQHTFHKDFDVQSPQLGGGRIVYQQGADLWLYDIAANTDRKLDIHLASDFDQMRERWITTPMQYVTAMHISPTGDRVALTARGELFVVPVHGGRLVTATRTKLARYRQGRFMPDGKSLLTLSDESGEVEFWTVPANGVGKAEQLTSDATVLRWDGVPSPNGKWLAHYDKNQQLWLFDISAHTDRRIATNMHGDFGDLSWSPDSRWLAYVAPADNDFSRISLYDVTTGTTTAITSDRYDSESPAWTPDGKWLYFLSDRNLESSVGSPWGNRQPEPYFDRQTKIYLVPLRAHFRSPFQPADELHPSADSAGSVPVRSTSGRTARVVKDTSAAAKGTHASPAPVAIDLDGIQSRLLEVPVAPGNYANLTTNGTHLFFLSRERSPERKTTLQSLAIDNKKEKPQTVVDDVRSYELSANGKKILVRKGNDLYVFDAPKPKELAKSKIDLKDWRFSFDPREEWQQMFVEAWRLERDYFYDRGMNGIDWPAMRKKYLPLVSRVTSRGELSDILGQMIGELSALHMFVYGGDMREGRVDVEPASLGATFVRDASAGGFRVTHIFQTDPDLPAERAPLAQPGVDVHEGDVIVAINGVPASSLVRVGDALRDQAGKQVLLRVRPKGSSTERDVIVVPASERQGEDLRYREWEYTRRLAVEKASHGTIGYLHLRAMGSNDIAQFVRDYYPVFNRQGLIIDVRNNRGGNIDSWIIERLMRKAWSYWAPRVGAPSWNMQRSFRGHIAVIQNERTASDGELFTEGIEKLGIAKVFGVRSWGGEIWLSSSNFLVDHGIATAAENGVYGPGGQWLVEQHGVDPDVVVDNLPHATFAGQDAQLDAAVDYLKQEITLHPVPVPVAPKYPDRSIVGGGGNAGGAKGDGSGR
jgi:tricorn protease